MSDDVKKRLQYCSAYGTTARERIAATLGLSRIAELEAQLKAGREALERAHGALLVAEIGLQGVICPSDRETHASDIRECELSLRSVREVQPIIAAAIAALSSQPSRIDAAVRASETVEATSPAKRDCAARVMRDAEAQMGALQEMKAAEDADIDFLIDNLKCGNAADRDVIRLFRKQIIQAAAAYAVQAMAEPTREEIAATVLNKLTGGNTRDMSGEWLCPLDDDGAWEQCLDIAAAILALKPRGEPAREGGE